MSEDKSAFEDKVDSDNIVNKRIEPDESSAVPAPPKAMYTESGLDEEIISDEDFDKIEEEFNNVEDSLDSELPDKLRTGYYFYRFFRIFCLVGFVIFTALFINEEIIQPYQIKKTVDLTRELYHPQVAAVTVSPAPVSGSITASASDSEVPAKQALTDSVTNAPSAIITAVPTPEPVRDEQGRLLQFKDLLALNEDVKGWLIISDTTINYVVMQSDGDDPDFYLHNDINKEYSKAGTLYLDSRASIENNSKNFVIYGHNMVTTTEKMFHPILQYKDKNLEYYKQHPLLSFDTIYQKGTWKIFAVFITTPDSDKDGFFDYRKSDFIDSSDFLNFVYQIRIRSLLNIDTVDINENDQLLLLSTCSYEVNRNYRTVVAARKVREGEASYVDVDSVTLNKKPLYAEDYYDAHGGKAPKLAATFEEALTAGEINWYTKPGRKLQDKPVQ